MRKGHSLSIVALLLVGAYFGARSYAARSSISAANPTNALPPSPPPPLAVSTDSRPAPAVSGGSASLPAKVAKARPANPGELDRYLAKTWLDTIVHYHEVDRGQVLDGLVDSLVRQGPGSVSELAGELSGLAADQGTERAAIFHALGRVGAELTSARGKEAEQALATIHRVAQSELDLPAYIPPNPELDVDHASPEERAELVHHGNLVERDGKLVQSTTLNKVSAIQMLTAVGNDDSLEQLEAMRRRENSHVLQLAVEHAVQLVKTKSK